MGKTCTWSDDELVKAVAASLSWSQVARSLGLKSDGGSSRASIRRASVRLSLDTSHFREGAWNKGTGNGRDPIKQQVAQHRWYLDHKQMYLDRNRRRYEENCRRLRELKKEPCLDCGQSFPSYVMDFDHREGTKKSRNISGALRYWSWRRVLAEIAKCDLVCANCHRIRTARRAGYL